MKKIKSEQPHMNLIFKVGIWVVFLAHLLCHNFSVFEILLMSFRLLVLQRWIQSSHCCDQDVVCFARGALAFVSRVLYRSLGPCVQEVQEPWAGITSGSHVPAKHCSNRGETVVNSVDVKSEGVLSQDQPFLNLKHLKSFIMLTDSLVLQQRCKCSCPSYMKDAWFPWQT